MVYLDCMSNLISYYYSYFHWCEGMVRVTRDVGEVSIVENTMGEALERIR